MQFQQRFFFIEMARNLARPMETIALRLHLTGCAGDVRSRSEGGRSRDIGRDHSASAVATDPVRSGTIPVDGIAVRQPRCQRRTECTMSAEHRPDSGSPGPRRPRKASSRRRPARERPRRSLRPDAAVCRPHGFLGLRSRFQTGTQVRSRGTVFFRFKPAAGDRVRTASRSGRTPKMIIVAKEKSGCMGFARPSHHPFEFDSEKFYPGRVLWRRMVRRSEDIVRGRGGSCRAAGWRPREQDANRWGCERTSRVWLTAG